MIRIVQIGLGPLGQKTVQFALNRQGLKIVAAVDPAPQKAGRDLGELCGLKPMGLKVQKDLKSALKGKKADVAVLTTVSSLKTLEKQVVEIVRAGLHVVSTCEELSFPWRTQPRIAARIDKLCRRHRVACVGSGVNPGFLMDYLPAVLSSVCQKVDRVKITRIQDASQRRIPFQQKIGAGLTPAQFRRKKAEGTLRHVGLRESVQMIARSLNWPLSRYVESLKPVMAGKTVSSGYVRISKGVARGVEQIGRGYIGGKEVIRLHFRAAVGEKMSMDLVEISGVPNIRSVIPGGVNGDIATCAITLNAVHAVQAAAPGLKTMLDLPVPSCYSRF